MNYIIWIITTVIVLILLSGIKIVQQQTAFTVETLGRFTKVIFPGFHVIIPLIQRTSRRLNLATLNLDISIQAISSDKVNVKIDTSLIYRVLENMVYQAAYSLDNPIATLKSLVENNIRAYVATQTHEEVIRSRDDMTQYLTTHLTAKFAEYGYSLESIQFRDIVLPLEITEAMSRVVSSKRLQEAAQNEAQAEFIKQVRAAEAQKETRRLQGEGVAQERKAITDGLASSILDLKNATGTDSKDVMNVVLMNQWIDMMRTVTTDKSGNTRTVFLNPGPNGMTTTMQEMSEMMK